MPSPSLPRSLITAASQLSEAVDRLKFESPVAYVYNPLSYAWPAHKAYLQKYGCTARPVVFLGMNPGPFGMAQTGVPFGEVKMVSDWLGISTPISKPPREHPRRPVEGFACKRSEVSGGRLWGLFADRFKHPDKFFARHFVANYCPLAFLDEGGRNLTPDKLRASERDRLQSACDRHLRSLVQLLQPEWIIGVGDFAEKQCLRAFPDGSLKIGRILHPSPASPAANRNWAAQATEQLQAIGVW